MKLLMWVLMFVGLTAISQSSYARQQEGRTDEMLGLSTGPAMATDRKDYLEMKLMEEAPAVLAVRPEHLELNVGDPKAVVKWYCENLGMKVVREGAAPSFTTFIADSGRNMMLEITHSADYPALDFAKIHHMSLHLAFMVNDVPGMKAKLLLAGAVLVEDISKTPSGDQVLMLRDPWGLPIQFVQRTNR